MENEDGRLEDEHNVIEQDFISLLRGFHNELGKERKSGKHEWVGADLVELVLQPIERSVVPALVRTGNEQLDKVFVACAVLCDEVNELSETAKTKFYPALALYGETGEVVLPREPRPAGTIRPPMEELGSCLVFFVDVYNFCLRCNDVAVNIVAQLSALYDSREKLYQNTFRGVHLIPVWTALGDLLSILITVDAIVKSNTHILSQWAMYKDLVFKTLFMGTSSSSGFDNDSTYDPTTEEEIDLPAETTRAFEELLVKLDGSVFSSSCFAACIEQQFSENTTFMDEFLEFMRLDVKDLSAEWKAANLESDSYPSFACETKLVGLTGLFVMYTKILPVKTTPDPTVFKSLWALQGAIPVVILYGKVTWVMDLFLTQHMTLPIALRYLNPKDGHTHRKEFLTRFLDSLNRRIPSYVRQVGMWQAQMDHILNFQSNAGSIGVYYQRLFVHGLTLAHRVKRVLNITLGLHQLEQIPMTRNILTKYLSVCIELLQSISRACSNKLASVVGLVGPIGLQCLKRDIQVVVAAWRTRLEARRGNAAANPNPYGSLESALTLFNGILKGSQSVSFTRTSIARIALSILESSSTKHSAAPTLCQVEEISKVDKFLDTLVILSDWQTRIKRVCDCSILYWQFGNFFPVIVGDILRSLNSSKRLLLVLRGYCDAENMLRKAQHNPHLAVHFESSFIAALKQHFIEPLCQGLDGALRLHQHAVHMDFMKGKANPKSGEIQIFLRQFLAMPNIVLMNKVINIKFLVEQYLQRHFYDMTVLALHDWKTYAEMRKIAKENYGLELDDSCLPQGTLDTGLDVLQIMRRISIFVALYNYNMNQQFFIERKAERGAKHLKTINIQSISHSIGTHGLGIMNTCVNFTYQYLAKSFEVFSEFLFDDNIRSYLARERRWFAKHKKDKKIDHMYPFAHAFAYNKEIRRLGEPSPGVTYLCKFRQHITKIGNALGYVRMVRSAGMHWVSDAIDFVPDLNNIPQFSAMSNNDGEPEAAGSDHDLARANLDAVLNDLSRKFAEETDYLTVLVDVFQQVMLKSEGTEHLQNFYMIIPSLTVSYVEAILLAKDQIARSHKGREAYFCDDGLAMGIAYVLSILNQTDDFAALRWFKSIDTSFTNEINTYKAKLPEYNMNPSKKEETERRIKRLEVYLQEYQLFQFALSGALIFFSKGKPGAEEAPHTTTK